MRLGTRGSALALAQARLVADLLGGAEIVEVETSGDRGEVGDKARFVKELEEALLAGEVDLAVHSAKDVPATLPEGLALVGVPDRADARDALCGAADLSELREGAVVGTASVRRRSQLLAQRPDLQVAELRGNVDTRLRKLAEGEAAAIVLACAGLARLGRSDEGSPMTDLVPAAGPGLHGAGGTRRRLRRGRGRRRDHRPGLAGPPNRRAGAGDRAWTPPATRRSAPWPSSTARPCA